MKAIIIKQIKAPNPKSQHNVPIKRHRILMGTFKRTEKASLILLGSTMKS